MGPSKKHNVSKKTQATKAPAHVPPHQPAPSDLPIELQQAVLNAFSQAALPLAQTDDLKAVIQEVKGHLFLRDFASAFAKQEFLDAYTLRWSASRALGYASIFLCSSWGREWFAHAAPAGVGAAGPGADGGAEAGPPPASACKVVCIGGGAGAELAALAAACQALPRASLDVVAVDIADWSRSVERLTTALTSPPPLSTYASASAKAANRPLVHPDQMCVHFAQRDVLALTEDDLHDMLVGVRLCTIMFTLNELFTTSISRTTAFLLALTDAMPPGSCLLVVDSPGSYSEIKLGEGQPRQYPMKWLLDHTLLEVAGKDSDETTRWQKLVSDESRWFRVHPGLKYPVELENMRYQIHVYQRSEQN